MAFEENSFYHLSVIAIITYNNTDTMKNEIIKENIKKSGVYRWKNNITGDCYIGSSIDLSNRLRLYFRYDIISDTNKGNSIINSALLKYGYSNFSLEILEYCEKEIVLNREQYFLDTLNPVYNILKVAGSNSGHKQREESIIKRVKTFADNKKIRENLKPIEISLHTVLVAEEIETLDSTISAPLGKDNSFIVQSPLKGSKRPINVIELMRQNYSRSKTVYEYKADKVTLIAKYDSLRQAQEKTGLTREYISRCIKVAKLAHNSSWYSFTELKS
jgi:group I intron endonuclease